MNQPLTQSIKGGGVLIIGDTHFSDKFQGQHRDYQGTCFEVMERIEGMVEEVVQRCGHCGAILFLGDLFGVKEKQFVTREFMVRVYSFFERLNVATDGNVYSVRGNHDIAHNDLPDFEVFRRLGAFKVVDRLDFHDTDTQDQGIRFHFIHYGHEREELTLSPSLANVGLAHNDFGLPGFPEESWFTDKGYVLSEMDNYIGLSMLISGHIHNPSPGISDAILPDGSEMNLYYPGNPTRVSQRFDDCGALLFNFEEGHIHFALLPFNLKPLSEEFYDKVEDDNTVESTIDEDQLESLQEIVGTLSNHNLLEGNLINQIQAQVEVPKRVRDLSAKYLQEEIDRASA